MHPIYLDCELMGIGYTEEESEQVEELLKRGELPPFVKANIGFVIDEKDTIGIPGYHPIMPRTYDNISEILENPVYLCAKVVENLEKNKVDLQAHRVSGKDTTENDIVTSILMSTTEKRLSEGKFSFNIKPLKLAKISEVG